MIPKAVQTFSSEGRDGIMSLRYQEEMVDCGRPELAAVPRRYAIARADRLVLGQVDHLIAWVTHPGSSAAGLLAYARRREAKGLLRVTLLGGDEPDGRSSFP